MSDDKLRMVKTRLPAGVRQTIQRLTSDFDPESKASIEGRAGGTFQKLERADTPTKDE